MRSRVVSPGRALGAVRTLADGMKRDRLGTYAAESAFFLILSAIPLLTLTVSTAHLLIPEFVSEYLGRLAELLPGVLGEYVGTELSTVYDVEVPLSVSAVAVLWGASRGVRAVFGEDGGPALAEALYGISFTAAFILIIVAVLAFFVFGDQLSAFVGARFPAAGAVFDIAVGLSPILTMLALTGFFTLVYATFTPDTSCPMRLYDHLPGASVAAAGWTLYSYIFSVFVSDFSDMPRLYGSLAATVVLMIWLYMVMYIILVGAEVNKLLSANTSAKARPELVKKSGKI